MRRVSRGPTARWGGSSTATSMPSSGSRVRAPEPCARAHLARRRPGSSATGCGAAIRCPARAIRRRGWRASAAWGEDVLLGRRRAASRAGGRPDGEESRRSLRRPATPAPRSTATWFAASGMRASDSHRVVFRGAPVLVLGGRRASSASQPWFGRDALRTTASWVGLADTAGGRHATSARRPAGRRRGRRPGRRAHPVHAQSSTWGMAEAAARPMATPARPARGCPFTLATASAHAVEVIATRPPAPSALGRSHGRDPLDRAARDLRVFLLQHRLDPMLARAGAGREAAGSRGRLVGAQPFRGALCGRS